MVERNVCSYNGIRLIFAGIAPLPNTHGPVWIMPREYDTEQTLCGIYKLTKIIVGPHFQ